MRHFKLLPAAIVLFISIVFICTSHLSAAVAVWSDFNVDPASKMNSHFAKICENGVPISLEDLAEFNRFDISWSAASVRWVRDQDQTSTHEFFPDIHMYETRYTMPDEPLMPSMNFRALNWDSDLLRASSTAEHIVSAYDRDCAKNMRIPSPASLVLVAVGLLSLRFTRRWKF